MCCVVSAIMQVVDVTINDTIAADDTIAFGATADVVSHFQFSLTSETKSKLDIYLSPM